MRLGKRTVYALLAALICFNVMLRLPRTPHEIGIDSYFIHNLAGAISQQGRIPWVVNVLGYFGWYPLSYPSAGPLLISGLAQTSGLTEEQAILSLSLLYGAVGALTAFALARTFRRDDAFALIVATFFSLAPRFMSFTLWSASSRSLFMVLLPVFVWSLVRAYRRPNGPNVFVLVSVLSLLIATHRLTILLAVVVLASVVAYVFILMNRVVRIRFPKLLLSSRFRHWAPGLALLAILLIAVFMFKNTDVLQQYSAGLLCEGQSVPAQACNLGVSITRSVGLSLVFSLPGVVYLVRARNKGFLEAFLCLSLLALIPTLFLRQYTGFYILPFVALFAGVGFAGIVGALGRRPRARAAVALVAVLAIAATSVGLLQYEVDQATMISDPNYSTALYLQGLPGGTYVANDGLLAIRVSAVSGKQGLPVGGAGTTSQSPELLIMGAYNSTDLFRRERRIPLTDLTIEDDSPFILDNLDALADWQQKILWLDVDNVKNETRDRYHLQYYLELDEIRGKYQAFGRIYEGTTTGNPFGIFAKSIHEKRFKIYDGTTEDIYLAFPIPAG